MGHWRESGRVIDGGVEPTGRVGEEGNVKRAKNWNSEVESEAFEDKVTSLEVGITVIVEDGHKFNGR